MTVLEVYQKVASRELTPKEGALLLHPPSWRDHLPYIALILLALVLLWV